MADKEMELLMRIRAEGQQAIRELGRVNDAISRTQKSSMGLGGVGASIRSGFGVATGALGAFLKPLKIAAGVGLVVGGVLAAMGASAVSAAGEYEQLRIRLEAVTGSAEKAGVIFKEVAAFAAATPFEIGDLINARILLEGIGVTGQKALTSASNAAAAMGRNVTDLAMVVASLETEPLRRLGIQLQREGERSTFQFTDRMQRIRTVVVNGAKESREALLNIFNLKFGGATAQLGLSIFGRLSTLKDNIKQAFAQVGNGMLPAIGEVIDAAVARLDGLLKGDVLTNLGERIGAAITQAFDYGTAIIEEAGAVWQEIKGAPTVIAEALRGAMVAGGTVLAVAFFEYIKASVGIFAGIGKILAGAFMDDILRLEFMRGDREAMAKANMEKLVLDPKGEQNPGTLQGFFGISTDTIDEERALQRRYRQEMARLRTGHMGVSEVIRLATMDRPGLFQEGVEQAMGAMPQAAANIKARAVAEFAPVLDGLSAASGRNIAGNVADRVEELKAAREQNRYAREQNQYARFLFSRTTMEPVEGPYGTSRYPVTETREMIARRDTFALGQQGSAGSTVVKIDRLEVKAENWQDVQRQIEASGGHLVVPLGASL